MASVQRVENGAGVHYRVRWRDGGTRDGKGESERFPDEDSATLFAGLVEKNGHKAPPGWVSKKGFITVDEDRFRFETFARKYIANKTGIEDQYRRDCYRDLERWLLPTFGNLDVRSVEHFCGDTVQAWVRELEQTMVARGQLPKQGEPKLRRMSPKTIRNLHGLLSAILQKAVIAEPQLRQRNPCELTRLPRVDDDGGEDGQDIYFLTPAEVQAVIANLERRSDQLLVTIKYGTGLRWGEVSALAPECLEDWGTREPQVYVMRAWKKDGTGGYKIGVPKSARSRRHIRISEEVVDAFVELGGFDADDPGRLYFTGDEDGKRLHYSTFYDRWQRAVKRAHEAGLLPKQKRPTPHDLRHSHAAVLLSEGRGLLYVRDRLGHKSITTTADTYGHLLKDREDEAMEAIDRSLGRGTAGGGAHREAAVHTVEMPGGRRVGFWNPAHAGLLVEVWKVQTGTRLRVEPWPVLQWQRMMGIEDARAEFPELTRVWSLGPAVYGPDGTERAGRAGVHELREEWVWEWDRHFTTASAHSRSEWLPGPAPVTEAAAWGVDPDEVRKAYVRARSTALRMCGRHPSLTGVLGEDQGMVQMDS